MEFVEFSAKTVSDAITKACEHFEIPSTKLDYDVIDQGSNGFLGIGAREAKIKARAKTDEEILKEEREKEEEIKRHEQELERERRAKEEAEKYIEESTPVKKVETVNDITGQNGEDKKSDSANAGIEAIKEASYSDDAYSEGSFSNENEFRGRRERRGRHERGGRERHSRSSYNNSRRSNAVFNVIEEKNGVKAFLKEMFAAMDMEVNIELKYAEEERIMDIDFSGPSMGILIGKRGQTLDAIQYLCSLVINKGEDEYIHVKVDTENYRKRRKDTLENLAKNISYKVKHSRKPVSLEPMNPYERRIIHSALQNERYVTTYSEGNEPYRRVVVAPKNYKNGDF